jgi:plastocyanin
MKRALIAAALLALLVPASAGSANSERAVKRVSAYNNYFSPKSITVARGTKVTWTVRQGVHNVVGRGLASPIMSKGRTYSKKFKRGGTYRYVCTLHSGMGGKVTVR